MLHRVTCTKGHVFDIEEVVLPVEVIGQIVPCPYDECGGRVMWKRVNSVDISG